MDAEEELRPEQSNSLYEFNEQSSALNVTSASHCCATERPNMNRNSSNSFLACVLKLSQDKNEWKVNFRSDDMPSGMERDEAHLHGNNADHANHVNRNAISGGLSIVLNVMRVLCFYPSVAAEHRKKQCKHRWVRSRRFTEIVCGFVLEINSV
ncbi:unnamed protein product [Anisakis simplex]|uniref:CACTA en-spm transposon protein n=1 Tax=Anisakis simplex TaxID=6269 RepID=A0A0M3J378_ANISI|nr:unnamed protein product [Anisakis simplex]